MKITEEVMADAVAGLMTDFEALARAVAATVWDKAYARGVADERERHKALFGELRRVLTETSDNSPTGPARDAPPPMILAPDVDIPDAATLSPITEKQAKVFEAVCELTAGTGYATISVIAKRSGYTNVVDSLQRLVAARYIAKGVDDAGTQRWRSIAMGSPRTELPRARNWSDDELRRLQEVAFGDGDFEALGKIINRSAAACEQQARSWGWYSGAGLAPGAPPPTAPPSADVPASMNSPEVTTSHVVVPPPENAQVHIKSDDEAADLDDLTKSGRDVLLALQATGDGAYAKGIAKYAETDTDRVPGALARLAELKLAETRDGGRWYLTDAGQAMVIAVREDEA